MARSSSPAADVPCVILAGGLATRMLPHTTDCPKILLPVAGEPFAAHQLRWLASEGIRRVVIAVGHLGEQVEEYVGDGRRFGVDVAYSADGARPLGTGGALRAAVERHVLTGPVIVVYGDSYLDVGLELAVRRYHENGLPALMVVFRNRDAFDTSNAAFDGRLVRYEKGVDDPRSAGLDMIDYGLSIFEADEIRRLVPADEPSELSALQSELSRDGRLSGLEVFARFYEIGSPAGLAELDELIRTRSG